MSQHSIWRAKFHMEVSAGRVTGGPYTTFVGISGGTRGDGQTPTTAAAIVTAITNNLLNILKSMTTCAGSVLVAVPAGSVVLEQFEPASVPDAWE